MDFAYAALLVFAISSYKIIYVWRPIHKYYQNTPSAIEMIEQASYVEETNPNLHGDISFTHCASEIVVYIREYFERRFDILTNTNDILDNISILDSLSNSASLNNAIFQVIGHDEALIQSWVQTIKQLDSGKGDKIWLSSSSGDNFSMESPESALYDDDYDQLVIRRVAGTHAGDKYWHGYTHAYIPSYLL